eukprot:TRINITY_DN883_c0_g1_i2.p2 TRINITY_DN883_c0_g1~~TRINITY_DN883_c0_g1_i2.p2  ORF type:complete len:336 (+),score=135.54 TRINITY_DN883_c0_g1_i2:85-1092(+)
MGKKKTEEQTEPKEEPKAEGNELPDSPAVVALKALDDKYLEVEREMEKEIEQIRLKFQPKLQPFLEERRSMLADAKYAESEKDAKESCTPACPGFWLQALKQLPSTSDEVEPHDEEVLEYLRDVRCKNLDDADEKKGFKIEFEFSENPFFEDTTLWIEVHTKEKNPWCGEITCSKMVSSVIQWKAGKDVTVELVAKKVKGGGAKKAKQKGKATEEPRDSFFRSLFRNLKIGDPMPEDINVDGLDIDDDDEFMEEYLENQCQVLAMVKDYLVPHAVRVYSGEAFPEEDDDEDEEEEEETDDESEEDSEPAPRKGGGKKAGGAKAGAGKDKEECKQQ